MSIKIGDKVRFLNDIGGGIVSAFSGKDQVIVEREDGFGFPVLIKECVLIASSNVPIQTIPNSQSTVKSTITSNSTRIYTSNTNNFESKNNDDLNIYLAYLPTTPDSIQQTIYDTYLVNNSDYALYFTYLSRKDGLYICRHNAVIEANSQLLIETFSKDELNNIEHICVQIIAFKRNKPFTMKVALSVELHLDIVKFYKRNYFTKNRYFNTDAFITPVVKDNIPEHILKINSAELQEAITQRKSMDYPTPSVTNKKKKVKSDVIEIDLHIHELLDSTAGMSSGDIFQHQMSTFRTTLKENEKNKRQKLVFIHGKGDGVLRRALEKELRTNNKNITYQDASFCEYGFGAIMIII